MKKDAEHISVITVRAIPRPKLMVLRTSRQKHPPRVYRHAAVLNVFKIPVEESLF